MAAGVARARWPGRFQRLTKGPLAARRGRAGADLWLDGGHNPHAARALARAAPRLPRRDGRPWSPDRRHARRARTRRGFFAAFAALKPRVIAVRLLLRRTPPTPSDLVDAARAAGLSARRADDAEAAVSLYLAEGGDPAPTSSICGSLHFIGDILAGRTRRPGPH